MTWQQGLDPVLPGLGLATLQIQISQMSRLLELVLLGTPCGSMLNLYTELPEQPWTDGPSVE